MNEDPMFVAIVMVPVTQSFKASSVEHAHAMVRDLLKTNFQQNCTKGDPQPFLHSMRVIPSDVPPIPEAA